MKGLPYRLESSSSFGRLIDRDTSLNFHFDGASLSGYSGDTLASALMANGRRVLGRSFKYHRARGLVGLGFEEPNALFEIGDGSRCEPNIRGGEVELYDGLVGRSQNCWPSVHFDLLGINGLFSRFLSAGFYYKTFMYPRSFWKWVYEPLIRKAAGLGHAPVGSDPSFYEHIHVHCDVLVVGGGISGVSAALAASDSGARVILADQAPYFGGMSDLGSDEIEGLPAWDWVQGSIKELSSRANVCLLDRVCIFGHYPHNFLMGFERVCDHDPDMESSGLPRHRLWKIRAREVIVATGSIERPMSFAYNDLPGVMLSSAAHGLAVRYGVASGKRGIIFTNNDYAYEGAFRLHEAGMDIRVIDVRRDGCGGDIGERVRSSGLPVENGLCVSKLRGSFLGHGIKSAFIAPYSESRIDGRERSVGCDFVGVSGGWNPSLHLFCHMSGRIKWRDDTQCFVPLETTDRIRVVGWANGTFSVGSLLDESFSAGHAASKACGFGKGNLARSRRARGKGISAASIQPVWFVAASGSLNEGMKHFVDFQNDVTVADIALARREGFHSLEHTKRYTTLGMATDQGRVSSVTGVGIVSMLSGIPMSEMGVTTYRPPVSPVSFGCLSGHYSNDLFAPIRKTCAYSWHEMHGGDFEPVGLWRRPYCYRGVGEDRSVAVSREVLLVRHAVGVLDASTLGKIEICGTDAGLLLDRIYTNKMSNLPPDKCRYGLMMNERGFLMDDGVCVCLGADHFLVHTTSGGADSVAAWFEEWVQTEWMDLRVFITDVTEGWCQYSVAGPRARDVMSRLESDIDFSASSFPFMGYRSGYIEGFRARVFRISFSGELSYEIAVPSRHGAVFWDILMEKGRDFGIGAYGTEALHILRAEKGFIVVGDETDGTVTPLDLGLGWAVSKKKDDYLGKRSLSLPHLSGLGRRQLVGLETEVSDQLLPHGCYGVELSDVSRERPPVLGFVSSSYFSPTLSRSIAMGLIEDGVSRKGDVIGFPVEGGVIRAKIVDPVFYDPAGERQNV